MEKKSETWLEGEPDLGEMLADPIVRLVMRRDGLGCEQVRDAIAQARMALSAPAARPGVWASAGGRASPIRGARDLHAVTPRAGRAAPG